MASLPGYLALGNIDANGAFAEIVGGGYARQAVTLDPNDAGEVVNTAAVQFPNAIGSAWPKATAFGIFDAATGGNARLYFGVPRHARSVRVGHSSIRVEAKELLLRFPKADTVYGTPVFAPEGIQFSQSGLAIGGGDATNVIVQGRPIYVTALAKQLGLIFVFDGVTDDLATLQAVLNAAPGGTTLVFPESVTMFISAAARVPSGKSLWLECPESFIWYRNGPYQFLIVDSGLSHGGDTSLGSAETKADGSARCWIPSAIVQTSIAFAAGGSNTLCTRYDFAASSPDMSMWEVGDIAKICSEDALPFPSDDGSSRLPKMGYLTPIEKIDLSGATRYLYAPEVLPERKTNRTGTPVKGKLTGGAIEDGFKTSPRMLRMSRRSSRFGMTGGSFLSSGAWMGVTPVEAIRVVSRYMPRITGYTMLNGSGAAIGFVGCFFPFEEPLAVADMANKAGCPGYGSVDTASRGAHLVGGFYRGDMRHGKDANVAFSSIPYNFDVYGRPWDTVMEEANSCGLGHSVTATHADARNTETRWGGSYASYAGYSAAGAADSCRSKGHRSFGRHSRGARIGIEAFEQFPFTFADNLFKDWRHIETTSALISTSIVGTGLFLDGLTIEAGVGAISKGSMWSACTGRHVSKRNEFRLLGSETIGGLLPTNFAPFNTVGSDVEFRSEGDLLDLRKYEGGSQIVLHRDGQGNAARTGVKLLVRGLEVLGDAGSLAALVDALGSTVANEYYFEDCNFPAGFLPVINAGNARVVVASTGDVQITPANDVISPHRMSQYGNAAVPASSNPVFGFVPYKLRRGQKVKNIFVAQGAAGSAGMECRVGIYAQNPLGRVGRLLLDDGTIDLSGSTGFKSPAAAIDFTAPYTGIYWIATFVKGGAGTPQISTASIIDLSAVPHTTSDGWSQGATSGVRGYLATDAYGVLPDAPTFSATPGSVLSTVPAAFLVAG